MSQICLIKNALDQSENELIESDNVLKTFLEIKAQHPQARIYKQNPCPENDVTPSRNDKSSIAYLLETADDFTIICYPGELISAVNWVATKILGAAVSALVKTPKINNDSSSKGSSNNNLANPENKQRIKQRIPTILGGVKAVPDLFAPAYRYFVGGREVEELLLCLCDNDVQVSDFKEGDTPVQEIAGKSVTCYGLNQSLVGAENIYKIGEDFTDVPLIAKQSESVNGQTLLPPNGTRIESSDIYFVYPNMIKAWNDNTAKNFEKFIANEQVVVDGANWGVADVAITGEVTIDPILGTLSIPSGKEIANINSFKRINITSMLVNDIENGQLDLAGIYLIDSISYANSIYTLKLYDPELTNSDFLRLTEITTSSFSASLTASTASLNLNGTYTIANIDVSSKTMTLATPANVNSDWNNLANLPGKQTNGDFIKLRGSQENYIGWFTIDSKQAKGLLLNFRSANGIYKGNQVKSVEIEVEYQQVVNDQPVGEVYKSTATITGKANNRDAIGISMWIDLPFAGAVRFRARRTNDNGDDADLIDETKFYLAYAYRKLEKLVYSNRVLVRTRTVATLNATSQDSRQLNCIAQSLVYSYKNGIKAAKKIASRNIADLAIFLALEPKIGGRTIDEIDTDLIYHAVDEITSYFGSAKLAEFNYTLDDEKQSFEDIMRMMAGVTCSHDRRVNRKIYFEFESGDSVPLILFNHRNKESKSEVRTYSTTIQNNYDGIELTYVDSDAGWIEKTLKIPDEYINNPKKIEGTGIIYKEQAHIVAWREWNKLKFNRVTVKFNAYAESDLVFKGNTILNTDDTRLGNCTSGEVREWSGLTIKGSQPFLLDQSKQYLIHLQLKSGQIDVLKVMQGSDEYHFILERPPLESLVIEGQVTTVYSITADDRKDAEKFIVSQKSANDIFENEIKASNWDARYYRNDKDIINNLV